MIHAMMIVIVGLAITWVIGYPLSAYVYQSKRSTLSSNALHAFSFFVGYAVIVGAELVLVSLDIPVQYTAHLLVVVALICFAVLIHKRIIRLVKPSTLFVLALIAIVVITGFSYFIMGAQNYKGYGWWDILYYGSHAEFLKTTPFSQLDSLVQTNPYLGTSYHYFHGAHRIGRGVYQAFIASSVFIDGASTIGYMNIFASILTFLGAVYLTDGFGFKKQQQIVVAFAAAMVPNVTITQLEGFIPIGLFAAFVMVIAKMYLEQFRLKSLSSALLTGLLTTAFITTLLDGMMLAAGMFGLSVMIAFVTKQLDRKNLVFMVFTPLVVFLLTLPYQHQFAIELNQSVLRSGLNFIYPFAYTPGGLNWIFWGHTLLESIIPGKVYLVLTFLSIAFFIASYAGMYTVLTKLKRGEGLTMLAMGLMPFLFWSFKDSGAVMDLGYSFFKLLTFAAPIIVIGLFVFFNDVINWIKDYAKREKHPHYKKLYTVGYKALHSATCLVIVAFVIASAERVYRPLTVDSPTRHDRFDYAVEINNSPARAVYHHLDQSDKKVLLVSENANLGLWWSAYYGRNRELYSLSNMTYATYIADMPAVDLTTLPDDLDIVYAPDNGSNTMVDPSLNQSVALVMKTRYQGSENLFVKRNKTFYTEAFSWLLYAKEAHEGQLKITVDVVNEKPVTITMQSQSVTITKSGTYTFKIQAKRGAQEIQAHMNDGAIVLINNIEYGK